MDGKLYCVGRDLSSGFKNIFLGEPGGLSVAGGSQSFSAFLAKYA
jgi:hypothetical protein